MSNTLRAFLSHEWSDINAVSRAIYETLGIAIKPERLSHVLTASFPDVVADGILIRIVPQEPVHAPHPQPQQTPAHQRRRA